MIRTGFDTYAAAGTFIGIYCCYTVYDMDGIKLTYAYTASVAHTSVYTVLLTMSGDKCQLTAVSYTLISVLKSYLVTGTAALYICSHLN